MDTQTGSEFSFGRSARDVSDLPMLAPDLVRSYQQPFHLRIHPDKWELVDGKWLLQVERSHLRPGVGGVGGKERDLDSYEDTALLQQWAKHGDKRWAVIPNGDNRLRGIFGETGNFLRQVRVQTVDNYGRHRVGTAIIAAWEVVTELGKIDTDTDKLAEYSAKLAKAVLNIEGPSERAKSVVINKYNVLLNQLEATSINAKDGGTTALKRRINKIRRVLASLTGDASYTDVLFDEGPVRGRAGEKRKPVREKSTKPGSVDATSAAPSGVTPDAIAAALAQMSPEAIQAILDAKKVGGAS